MQAGSPQQGIPITQRRIAGVPVPVAVLGGAGIVAFLYIRHKRSAASSSSSSSSSGCAAYDANGNCIQAGTSQYGPYAYDSYGSPLSALGIPGVNCPYGVDGSGSCQTTPSGGSASAPTTGTWTVNPLGGQPGGAKEQQALLGTESYNNGFYNVYDLKKLQTAAPGNSWLNLLFPGVDPGKAVQSVVFSPNAATVAVPVYENQGAIPSSAVLTSGPTAGH